ncbi:peptidase S8/S53 domain-containing protein [Usnea florida]
MMLPILTVAAAAAFSTIVGALPASVNHVVHEKRSGSSAWSPMQGAKPDGRITLPVRIGLTESNLDQGDAILMGVSDPTSEKYGKHLTAEQIIEQFAPQPETINAVQNWLVSSGIEPNRISLSRGKNWLNFDANISEVEGLLKTEYKVYQHTTGQNHIACDDYSVPEELSQHIDLIMPTIHFDTKIVGDPQHSNQKRDPAFLPGNTDNNGWLPKKGKTILGPGADPDVAPQPFALSTCNTQITPDCLRALYNFTNGTLAKSSYGIVEYTPQAYLQSDLNLFYSNLAREIPSGNAPIFDSIDGGVDQTTTQSFNDNGESDLDLQYAIALVYPQKVTLYQAGDLVEGASFNNFLDAIDSSYCTSGGGDNPNYDATYPDPNSGGYKSQDCGRYTPASVISTSYGSNEADLSAAYEKRQCNEYMKLGMAGVTILYSSGDNGVAGNGAQCCTKAKCAGGTYNSGGSGTFNPSFPGTCPYVTSVGATQIVPGASVTSPEEACETVIYSGGGFSNVFPLPSYQSSAVKSYFANHKPSYTATQYNNSQTVRGYPDVSANGANYVVAVDGSLSLVYGTSASSPTFGSVVTLINEQRVNAGKSAVGFINPTLYANPSILNDITSGGNQGCGTAGFTAVSGWDPVTGLGTPNYGKMLPVFMALP